LTDNFARCVGGASRFCFDKHQPNWPVLRDKNNVNRTRNARDTKVPDGERARKSKQVRVFDDCILDWRLTANPFLYDLYIH
jgi:hypothetical protein